MVRVRQCSRWWADGEGVRAPRDSAAYAPRRCEAHPCAARRRPGGGGPGGWWIATEVEVLLETEDVVRPDVLGWRRGHFTLLACRSARFDSDWASLECGRVRHPAAGGTD